MSLLNKKTFLHLLVTRDKTLRLLLALKFVGHFRKYLKLIIA